jgi:pyrimidine operon attenuation protein/uracil phosphoribosyltransferase
MRTLIMSPNQVSRALDRLAYEIIERNKGTENVEVIGVRTRGRALAAQLSTRIEAVGGRQFAANWLDVAPYRDDRDASAVIEDKSEMRVDVTDRDLILVDDVLFTGRTTRAALDAIVRHGRPRSIQLVVLVDRGHREYPIKADYAGLNLPTKADERVVVEVGDKISVYLEED